MGKDLKGKECGSGIRQLNTGVFEGRFIDRHGKRVSLYDRNLYRLKNRIEKEKTNVKNVSLKSENITLSQWFNTWLTVYKYETIRPNTKRIYVQVFEKHIEPVLGNMKINNIKQLDIKRLINDLDKAGYKYETKNRIRILFIDMFDKAMIDDFVWKNPARGIKLIREQEVERRVLSKNEQLIFFETSRGMFYDNLFTVGINTGMRQGEICALTVQDLDFKKKRIHVCKTLLYQKLENDKQKEFHSGPPKTAASDRYIPMTRECEISLKKQILQHNIIMGKLTAKPMEGFENLLFTTSYGTPLNDEVVGTAIKKVIKEINMIRDDADPFETFSFHCFRHTFATRCFEAGMQPKTVQALLGHANLKMTMDLYTHVSDENKTDEMKKFEEEVEEIKNGKNEMEEEQYRAFIEREYKDIHKVVSIQDQSS